MMNYKPVTEEVLEALRKAVGAEYVMTTPKLLINTKRTKKPTRITIICRKLL